MRCVDSYQSISSPEDEELSFARMLSEQKKREEADMERREAEREEPDEY